MQITSVRYRELVSLRGCEHKALEATVGLGEPPEHARGSLSLLPFVSLKRELTDLLPRLAKGKLPSHRSQLGRGVCPPKAKVTRSNRVGCAIYAKARDSGLR
jgi:hypothetical protein